MLHKSADKLTEILIYFIVIFSPSAFGTTEPWAIWIINSTAYALGILLITKWITRAITQYDINAQPNKNELSLKHNRLMLFQKICTILLAGSIFLLLAYMLTSTINARATFNLDTKEYSYFTQYNKNLPHSYDNKASLFLFWQYLGLAILFWSIRDWLYDIQRNCHTIFLNPRLKRLLIIICLNGGILAFECILQRIYFEDNRGKLLFLIEPSINSANEAQFGPFAYRSNAASYLNIIWPLSLGLFLQLGRENLSYGKRRIGNGLELLLIPSIILIASGPIISSTRGGALVMIGLLILSTISLLFINIRSKFLRYSCLITLFVALNASLFHNWEDLESRFINIFSDNFSSRTQIYEATITMIGEYGIYGSGPGSFETIAQFELGGALTRWESWAHNDYLEFYLTFGYAGMLIICCIFILLIIKAALNLLYSQQRVVKCYALISLIGLAVHAAGDFPLQTLTILILVSILSALLTVPQVLITNSKSLL